jgi:ATP-dependent Clp protease protease subunit
MNNNTERELMRMLSSAPDSKMVWVTEFDSDAVIRFYDKFMELEKDPELQIVPVFINSYGGDVYALTAMRDLIKSSHKPVATIGVGMAMSCGASLLAAGTKGYRFVAKDIHLLIHQVSSFSVGKNSDVQESAKVTSMLNKKLFQNLADDSGKTLKEFEDKIKSKHNADWTLTANTARQWGLVDHIGIPRTNSAPPSMFLGNHMTYDQQVAMETQTATGKPSKRRVKPKQKREKSRA